MNAEFLRT